MKRTLFICVIATVIVSMVTGCSKKDTGIDIPKEPSYEIVPNSEVAYNAMMIYGALQAVVPGELDMDSVVSLFKELGIDLTEKLTQVLLQNLQFKSCVLKYPSVDTKGGRIWLSGRLYYLIENGKVVMPSHILLACHHTMGSNAQVPSSALGLEAAMAANKGLVIAPDYLGYGVSSDKDHPYCIPEQTAINVTDMLIATMEYFKDLGFPLNNLPVYCEGYSQGGQAALSVLKYCQEHSNLPKLTKTFCGGGPYSVFNMYDKWIDAGTCTYPIALVTTMIGLKTSYPDIITANVEDFFSKSVVDSGLIDKVRSKQYTEKEINAMFFELVGDSSAKSVKMNDVLSAAANDKMSGLYNQVREAALKCELTTGWEIKSPVTFIHAASDEIVNCFNCDLVEQNLKNQYTTFEKLDYNSFIGHEMNGIIFYEKMIFGDYLK